MVYLVSIVGFILGFLAGQKMLLHMLRDYSNKELLENKALRWKFGMLNWFMAMFGALCSLWVYNNLFL